MKNQTKELEEPILGLKKQFITNVNNKIVKKMKGSLNINNL